MSSKVCPECGAALFIKRYTLVADVVVDSEGNWIDRDHEEIQSGVDHMSCRSCEKILLPTDLVEESYFHKTICAQDE